MTVTGSVPYIVGAAVACIGVHLDQCSPKQHLLWGKVRFLSSHGLVRWLFRWNLVGHLHLHFWWLTIAYTDCIHDTILLYYLRLLCQDLRLALLQAHFPNPVSPLYTLCLRHIDCRRPLGHHILDCNPTSNMANRSFLG